MTRYFIYLNLLFSTVLDITISKESNQLNQNNIHPSSQNKELIFVTKPKGFIPDVQRERNHINAPTFSNEIIDIKKMETMEDIPFTCDCYNYFSETEENVMEIECKCFGKQLMEIPTDLNETLNKLTIIDSDIRYIKSDSLIRYRNTLTEVTLFNFPHLRVIERKTFAKIPNLRTLYITHAPQLKFLAGLLDGVTSKKFLSLRIVQTGLLEVPDLHHIKNIIYLVDLDLNQIETISANSIKIRAEQVTMNFNKIASIEDYAFNGSQIGKLYFKGNNKLSNLGTNAFQGLQSLRELDLSYTAIESLPVNGLSELEVLKIEKTPSMKTIPSIYDLGNLKLAKLTHSFHCCAFKYPEQHNPEKHAQHQEKLRKACQAYDTGQGNNVGGQRPKIDLNNQSLRRRRRNYDPDGNGIDSFTLPTGIQYENLPQRTPLEIYNINLTAWDQIPLKGKTIGHQAAKLTEMDEDFGEFHSDSAEIGVINAFCGNLSVITPAVKCYPEPNALNPCEDIMGSSWLRISVWFIIVLAVVGNLAVIIVVIFSGGEITVSRFLICNLAFADLCMGLYLLLLACMDLHAFGTYFNFAFDWQYGLGCQLAGFLTVFASHLSIFTLTVVTIERWFAITYAIHLTRRIRIGAAAKTMLGGWIYSILIATLPLLGITNYSSTSICLPMEVNRLADKAFLYAIILVNGIAFVLIVLCYAQIYLSLGYETRRSNTKGEMTIAKKMALLIFTDFATWAPIAFFGITALAGYPLIGVTRSKILLVFFYPLNACANPYLYVLMTAQYRKDFFILLSRCGLCKNTAMQYTTTTTVPNSNNSQPIPLLTKTNGHSTKSTNVEDAYV